MIMMDSDISSTALLLGLVVLFVHATFQLGISVLTLLSGHSLARQRSQSKTMRLDVGYILGSWLMNCLLLFCLLQLIQPIARAEETWVWVLVAIATSVVSIAVMLAYYRRGRGTMLWIPRPFASYLVLRARKTRNSVEAAALGMMTVLAELPFTLVIMVVIALLGGYLDLYEQFILAAVYALLVSLPLVLIIIMLGGGHRLSDVQRWRESNKTFMQYSAGLGMLAIAFYVIVFRLLGVGA